MAGSAPAVGGGGGGGGEQHVLSKEAAGMMALHEALRNVCMSSDWTYSVFWTIRPRPRCRGGNGCKVGDDNGTLMLMWEDGFCRPRAVAECLEDINGEDSVRKAFSKMSIQLYNYGEGLMGKVASDKCHKWVFKEPSSSDHSDPNNINNYWQSSFDALPPEWTEQFASGINTIAVIQAGHGLLQLGSCKVIPEDLHFVLRMRHMFESIGYQSGFFLSQLFSSSSRSGSPSPSMPVKQVPAAGHPLAPPLYSWNQLHLLPPAAASPLFPPQAPSPFHAMGRMPPPAPPHGTDHGQFFHLPHPSNMHMDHETPPVGTAAEHDADLKWPNGLSFFTALTGRSDDTKLLFGNNNDDAKSMSTDAHGHGHSHGHDDADYLSLESSHGNRGAGEGKFKRSFTLPARMNSATAAAQGMDYRGAGHGHESGMYGDIMETFLD